MFLEDNKYELLRIFKNMLLCINFNQLKADFFNATIIKSSLGQKFRGVIMQMHIYFYLPLTKLKQF